MRIAHDTLTLPGDPTPRLIVQPGDDKEYCVLWLQGWNSTIAKHKDRLVRLAEQTNITFSMIDYAGHGEHPVPRAATTRKQQFSEVLAAYDALKADGYENIIVSGTSFGGYMTALLTGERTPYAVILRAPAIYKDDEFTVSQAERQSYLDATYQKFKPTVKASDDVIALNNIRNYPKSVYVIEQALDSIIPKNIPRAYFQAAQRGNYLVVPNTEHSPSMMPGADERFAYIEQLLISIIQTILLEKSITN